MGILVTVTSGFPARTNAAIAAHASHQRMLGVRACRSVGRSVYFGIAEGDLIHAQRGLGRCGARRVTVMILESRALAPGGGLSGGEYQAARDRCSQERGMEVDGHDGDAVTRSSAVNRPRARTSGKPLIQRWSTVSSFLSSSFPDCTQRIASDKQPRRMSRSRSPEDNRCAPPSASSSLNC